MVKMYRFYKVEAFEIAGPYVLDVRFDDETTVRIDFEPVLFGELYGPLRDLRLFERVIIDADAKTLVWPNGADFDPATLHDWPEKVEFMRRQAAAWETVPA